MGAGCSILSTAAAVLRGCSWPEPTSESVLVSGISPVRIISQFGNPPRFHQPMPPLAFGEDSDHGPSTGSTQVESQLTV